LPSEERTYYVVYHGRRREALFGIRFRPGGDPGHAIISSVARIIAEDEDTASGCWYFMAIVEQVLVPNGVRRVAANVRDSDGGRKMFHECEAEQGRRYAMEWTNGTVIVHVGA